MLRWNWHAMTNITSLEKSPLFQEFKCIFLLKIIFASNILTMIQYLYLLLVWFWTYLSFNAHDKDSPHILGPCLFSHSYFLTMVFCGYGSDICWSKRDICFRSLHLCSLCHGSVQVVHAPRWVMIVCATILWNFMRAGTPIMTVVIYSCIVIRTVTALSANQNGSQFTIFKCKVVKMFSPLMIVPSVL